MLARSHMSSRNTFLFALLAMVFTLALPSRALSEWPLKGLPDEAQLAWQALRDADVFSFGPLGVAAETSGGELAMRILTRYPNAVSIFKLAAVEASPEGKLYALTALHVLDRETYKWALQVKPQGGRVYLQAACIGGKEPVADVLKRIESGTYDKHVPIRK